MSEAWEEIIAKHHHGGGSELADAAVLSTAVVSAAGTQSTRQELCTLARIGVDQPRDDETQEAKT